MSARISITPPLHFGARQPVALGAIYIDGELRSHFELSVPMRRISWLPRIWPNVYIDTRPLVQIELLRILKNELVKLHGVCVITGWIPKLGEEENGAASTSEL